MDPAKLTPKTWYWVQRDDGSLAPYVLYRVRKDEKSGRQVAEFFVGSFLQTFRLNQVVGPAAPPSNS